MASGLWGPGAGLAERLGGGWGNPASHSLLSPPALMENMNRAGRAPNTGDSIVLASAPASGDPAPAWPFSRRLQVLGQTVQEPQPCHLAGLGDRPWGTSDPAGLLLSSGCSYRTLLSSSVLRVLSLQTFSSPAFPHKLYFPGKGREGEGGGGGGRGGRETWSGATERGPVTRSRLCLRQSMQNHFNRILVSIRYHRVCAMLCNHHYVFPKLFVAPEKKPLAFPRSPWQQLLLLLSL